jgi:hypothetical protein
MDPFVLSFVLPFFCSNHNKLIQTIWRERVHSPLFCKAFNILCVFYFILKREKRLKTNILLSISINITLKIPIRLGSIDTTFPTS